MNDVALGYDLYLPDNFRDFMKSYPDDFLTNMAEMNVSLYTEQTRLPRECPDHNHLRFIYGDPRDGRAASHPQQIGHGRPYIQLTPDYMDVTTGRHLNMNANPSAGYFIRDMCKIPGYTYSDYVYPANSEFGIDLFCMQGVPYGEMSKIEAGERIEVLKYNKPEDLSPTVTLAAGHPFHQSILVNETDVPITDVLGPYGREHIINQEFSNQLANDFNLPINNYSRRIKHKDLDDFLNIESEYGQFQYRRWDNLSSNQDTNNYDQKPWYKSGIDQFANSPYWDFSEKSTIPINFYNPLTEDGNVSIDSTIAEYILEDLTDHSPPWLAMERDGASGGDVTPPLYRAGVPPSGEDRAVDTKSPTLIIYSRRRHTCSPMLEGRDDDYSIGGFGAADQGPEGSPFWQYRDVLVPAKTFLSIPRTIKQFLPSVYLSAHHGKYLDLLARESGQDSVYYYQKAFARLETEVPFVRRGENFTTKCLQSPQREAYLNLLDGQRNKMNRQLYMKIVRTLSNRGSIYDGIYYKMCNKHILQNIVLPAMVERIKILEEAMIVYGLKTPETFRSAYESIPQEALAIDPFEVPEEFTGYQSGGNVTINPSLVRKLFTLFETERVPKYSENQDTIEPEYDYYHVRYYVDEQGREVKVPYQDFIQATRDSKKELSEQPLDSILRKNLYLKPHRLGNRERLTFNFGEVQVEGATPVRPGMEFPQNIYRYVLGNNYGFEAISDELPYLDPRLPAGFLKSHGQTLLKKLLLDQDQDMKIEFDQIDDLSSERLADKLYNDNPLILEIASARVEHLSSIVVQELQNMNPNVTMELLPALKSIFSLIGDLHPSVGENLNLSFQSLESRNKDAFIGMTFGQGPYRPSIKMVEYESPGGTHDRYNIVIDSDIQLGLGPQFDLTRPWKLSSVATTSNPDQRSPERLDGSDESYRKIFRFCDSMPESITENNYRGASGRIARREAFAEKLTSVMQSLPDEIGTIIMNSGMRSSEMKNMFKNVVYSEITSNIFKQLTECLETSPLFDETYSDELETRVSGRPIVKRGRGSSVCVTNRYSLEAGSILSFDDVIVGDALSEVMAEMKKPENSFYERGINKLEPFDKAITSISIKAFIRTCLIDIMLKGGLAFSVWDIEQVVSSPVYIEYVKNHVISELNKSKTLGPIWSSNIEGSTGISNPNAAVESIVKEEIVKLPKYSKQLFSTSSSRKDMHNWFIYGKTLLPSQQIPRDNNDQLIDGVSDTDFFTKHGVFYRLPVPFSESRQYTNLLPSEAHGDSPQQYPLPHYMGSHSMFDLYTGHPRTEEEYYRVYGSFNQQYPTPTAKIIFEDYVRVSGQIVEIVNRSLNSPQFQYFNNESIVLSFEDYNSAINSAMNSMPSEQFIPMMTNSTISLGKRASLLLSGGTVGTANSENWADQPNSQITSIVKAIYRTFDSFSVASTTFRRFAYKEKAFVRNYRFGANSGLESDSDELLLSTIPLSSYEKVISNSAECVGFDKTSPIGPMHVNNNITNEVFLSHSDQFAQEQEFIDMFEHIFPVRRYIAMTSIFSTSVLGGFNDIPNLFDSTKAMLGASGRLASTPPTERADLVPNQADFTKSVNKWPGAMDDSSCFEFPGVGGEFFEAFWKELLKLMKYFPSIIFRGIASQMDPMYKEMRSHYMNCDLRELNWTALTGWTHTHKLTNGIKGKADGTNKNNSYSSILLSAPIDFQLAKPQLFFGLWRPMAAAVLKTLSYIYSGMLPFIDLSGFFKVPCADIDESWRDGEKYDMGYYGRYGQPISPFTILALSTLQLPADKDRRKSACEFPEETGRLPDSDCLDLEEEEEE